MAYPPIIGVTHKIAPLSQVLKWVNQTVKDKQMVAAAKLKARQKKDAQAAAAGGGGGGGTGGPGRGGSKLPEPIIPVFTVNPPVSARQAMVCCIAASSRVAKNPIVPNNRRR